MSDRELSMSDGDLSIGVLEDTRLGKHRKNY